MKKLFLFLPLVALLFAAACEDNDDDSNVNPYIIEIPEYVNTAISNIEDRVNVTRGYMFSDVSNKFKEVSSIECTSSALKIKLPVRPADEFLYRLQSDSREKFSVSNPNAKIGMIDIAAGMENQMIFGLRLSFDGDFDAGYVVFFYADRDVTINGPERDDVFLKYDNVVLKRGWNRVACRAYIPDEMPEGSFPNRIVYSMDIPTDAYWQLSLWWQ